MNVKKYWNRFFILPTTRKLPDRIKLLVSGLIINIGLISPQATAENGVMMQYFHWYLPSDGQLWNEVNENAASLSQAGVTAIWLPPAYKGQAGGIDVGYGVYDLYDLGEFDQKGSIRTKYGTKSEYLSAINQAHQQGIQVYGDVVLNHRGGAEATESVTATRVAKNNRNFEFGGDLNIDAWTYFDFPNRGNQYSSFKWRWYHFDGVDWAQNLNESSIFKFRGEGKGWDWEVDTENGNYDYLMFADVDFDHPDVVQELKDWGLWYVNETQVDGFRLDAIKHIQYEFFIDWLDHLRVQSGKSLFTVGEFWIYDKTKLHNYITKTNGKMSLFDAPLHLNFHQASTSGGNYDMRSIFDNTLVKEQPALAVTLVDNHDTQPCQALESPVQDWFKPIAYALILLRKDGYPNLFYADYYGASYTTSDNRCDNSNITIQSHRQSIDKLLDARKRFAYGQQIDYFDHWDVIGWTRLGNSENPRAMAAIVSDGADGSKWMNVARANKRFIDITGNRSDVVETNSDGWGNFRVNGGSYSVWVEQENTSTGTQVNFVCNRGETEWGEDVYVVGNHPKLGDWSPNNAFKLSPTDYPQWSGHLGLSQNISVEWKCIKRKNTRVVWQAGENTLVQTGTNSSITSIGSF